ncbi:DUF3168 domain-containing protein [Sphingomonas sp.]|uniref:DUF3168 domain-containing protein n=1 Tax=Sphingomonas sp. TaxID=28214 RepID=UPI003F72F35E
MSAAVVLAEAIRAALTGHASLADGLAGVFDAPPPRAATPHAVIGEALLTDWGTKDMAGREARVVVALHDAGESPARVRRLSGEVEVAMAVLPRVIGGGWELASRVLLRARIERKGEGRWVATSEWRLRMLKSGT